MARTNQLIFATSAPAVASAAPADRSSEFVAVTGAESDQVSAPLMVVAAYGIFWLLAFAFIYMTYQSQSRLAARVAELEKKLPKDTQVS
ncbi:MAG TPA: hypothetical protein VIV60_32515 [Polyangiaceae bacterium]